MNELKIRPIDDESDIIIEKLTSRCKEQAEKILKMRNCWNCTHRNESNCECKNFERWELYENKQ